MIPNFFKINTLRRGASHRHDAKLPGEQIGYKGFDMTAEEYYRKLTLEPTINIAGFHSGYGGEGSKTIIPATAKLKMDMRLVVD